MMTEVLAERPDLRLELRSRNNVLWHAIFDLYDSVAAFCRAHECEQGRVGSFLNLSASPYGRRGALGPTAQKLCEATGFGPDTLFPPSLYTGKFCLKVVEVESRRFVSLSAVDKQLALPPAQEDEHFHHQMASEIHATLETLTPREQMVIECRFGLNGESEHSCSEVGKRLGVGRARAQQIEARALRKLRHRSRTRRLRPFLDISSEWIEPELQKPEVVTTDSVEPSSAKATESRTVRALFVVYVNASIEELHSGAWGPDDVVPPPGGVNHTIDRVRVVAHDLENRVAFVVYGQADRPISFR